MTLMATPYNFKWEAYEDDFIVEHPYYTAKQLADHFGVSTGMVNRRRAFLIRTGRMTQLKIRQKSPYIVGSRTLLAKTCPMCGLLLDSTWFRFGRNQWSTHCVRCLYKKNRPDTKTYHKVKTERERQMASSSRMILQELTKKHAFNHRQPITQLDLKVLADPAKSHLEKAIELGRTYEAVKDAVVTRGLVSRIGRGDPLLVGGVWVIELPDGVQIMTQGEFESDQDKLMFERPAFEWDDPEESEKDSARSD